MCRSKVGLVRLNFLVSATVDSSSLECFTSSENDQLLIANCFFSSSGDNVKYVESASEMSLTGQGGRGWRMATVSRRPGQNETTTSPQRGRTSARAQSGLVPLPRWGSKCLEEAAASRDIHRLCIQWSGAICASIGNFHLAIASYVIANRLRKRPILLQNGPKEFASSGQTRET